jgi:hypothetical protein
LAPAPGHTPDKVTATHEGHIMRYKHLVATLTVTAAAAVAPSAGATSPAGDPRAGGTTGNGIIAILIGLHEPPAQPMAQNDPALER